VLPGFVPADGAANGVTTVRLYPVAHRRRPPALGFVFENVYIVGINGAGLRILEAGIFLLDSQDFRCGQPAALAIVIVMDGPAVSVLLDVIHSGIFLGMIKGFAFSDSQHPGGRRDDAGRGAASPSPCGRPWDTEEGRQAAGSLPAGSTLPLCQSAAAANIIRQAAGHRQVADKQGGAALPAPAGRGSSRGQLGEARQNHDRRGTARLACVFIA